MTKGQRLALYLLLSSRSQLRMSLEGRAHENDSPVPFGGNTGANDLYNSLNALVTPFGIVLDQPSVQRFLYDPAATDPQGELTGITSDSARIRKAVGMPFYDPNDPCPSDNNSGNQTDQTNILNALAGLP